jgi:hypothetical protein
MTRAKQQLMKEIEILQKQYNKNMDRYYKIASGRNYGLLYKEAYIISQRKRLLKDALTLIERYETTDI